MRYCESIDSVLTEKNLLFPCEIGVTWMIYVI